MAKNSDDYEGIRVDGGDPSPDGFAFTETPEQDPGCTLTWPNLVGFIRDFTTVEKRDSGGFGDEMPDDLPAGLVIHDEYGFATQTVQEAPGGWIPIETMHPPIMRPTSDDVDDPGLAAETVGDFIL